MHLQSTTLQRLTLKFTYGSLQWVHNNSMVKWWKNTSSGYITLPNSGGKWRKGFTYLLWLQTQWWWLSVQAAFTWTLNQSPDSKCHSCNDINTWDRNSKQGQTDVILQCMKLWLGSQQMNSKYKKTLDWET
jgi:hypothetical protein